METKKEESTEQEKKGPVYDVAHIMGQMLWLMLVSKSHRFNFFVGDMEWLIMPPIILKQFKIYYTSENKPAAAVLWAKVNDEVEGRLKNGQRKLTQEEWNSGESNWIIDMIAPYGQIDTILEDLQKNVFAGSEFNFVKTTPDGKREIVTLKGEASKEEPDSGK